MREMKFQELVFLYILKGEHYYYLKMRNNYKYIQLWYIYTECVWGVIFFLYLAPYTLRIYFVQWRHLILTKTEGLYFLRSLLEK